MSEIEEEPCQRKEDTEKVCSYDALAEHEYQQVSTPRSCEIRSFETDSYETFLVTKASERLPLPTSETRKGCVHLPCNASSNQRPLPTLATTHDYEYLSIYGISKQSTLPIPNSIGPYTNEKQPKDHARIRVTTV